MTKLTLSFIALCFFFGCTRSFAQDVTELKLKGVLRLQFDVFRDDRGYFQEVWNPARANIPSMVSAKVRSSSRGPVAAMRRDRSVALISRAVVVIISTGRSALPATHQPMARHSPNMITKAMIE